MSSTDLEDPKIECNGENGYKENDDDDETPNNLSPADSEVNITKKKRKSSAEKFLEDNSEYYGFQVLPSKLRSSSVDQSFLDDFLHHGGDNIDGAGISDDKQVQMLQQQQNTVF